MKSFESTFSFTKILSISKWNAWVLWGMEEIVKPIKTVIILLKTEIKLLAKQADIRVIIISIPIEQSPNKMHYEELKENSNSDDDFCK